jgi:hypothetical protein
MQSGTSILKIASIIFIVFGVIAAIVSIIALIGSAAFTGAVGGFAPAAAVGGFLIFGSIIALLSSALEIVIGFLGLKKCTDPAQFNFFIITGGILVVLGLVSLISSFTVTGLISFVLPGLYIYGGVLLKREAEAR